MSPIDALTPRVGLERFGRLRSLVKDGSSVSLSEISVLIGCGLAAAAAISLLGGQRWGIPGHAIVRAALPVSLGLALVPRRFSGSMVSLVGAAGIALFLALGVGRLPLPAVVALCGFGPSLDLATAERFAKLHLYVRFVVAGVAANSLALILVLSRAWLEIDELHGFVSYYVLCYVACGAVAGAVSGFVFFRSSGRDREARK